MYLRACTLALACTLAGTVLAQSGRRTATSIETRPVDTTGADIRLDADEVRLSVKVRGADGRLVRGLERSNFIVAENGERQDVTSFVAERTPVNLVLLLDACSDVFAELGEPGKGDRPARTIVDRPITEKIFGPPYQPPAIRIDPVADLAFTRRVAEAFLDRLGPSDSVSVVQLGEKVELLQDWTSDRESARHAVNWRFRLASGTAFWDGVYLAASDQLSKVAGQRVVVVIGDGVDTASRVSSSEAAAALDRLGTTLYVVSSARSTIAAAERYLRDEGGLLAPRRGQARRAIDALVAGETGARTLAERTGGACLDLRTTPDPRSIASSVLDDLGGAYVLSYVSSNERRDGSWREIEVFLDRPGLEARTRRGYYATAVR